MKLTSFLMIVSLLQVAATGFSQNVAVSIHADNVSLEQLFAEIEKQSDVKFLYRYENIDGKKTSIHAENVPVTVVLHEALQSNDLKYTLMDNNLIVVAPEDVKRQGVIVTGTVTDNGDPMPGVNVTVKGAPIGVVTDANGRYSINVPDRNATLIFSFMGYMTREFVVGDQNFINLAMEEDRRVLEEVVVTALGLKRDQKSLGYSTSTVKGEEMNQGAQSNMLKSLQGKTTGVDIVNLTSDPTSSVYVTIRGATSIQNMRSNTLSDAAQPLYVLDGIPIGNGTIVNSNNAFDYGNVMSRLNPNDIESITVLKGANAGALYGARAGNGVIMITTKSGAKARKGVGVSVSSAVTFDKMYGTLKTQNEFLQGSRYDDYNMSTLSGWGTHKDSEYAKRNWKQWDITKQEYYMGPLVNNDEDRVLAFMQTGISNTNDIVVTGNYDKGNYRFSYQNLTNIGVIPNNTTNRNSIGFSGMYKILEKLTINTSANFTRTYSPNKTPFSGQFETSVMEVLYGTRGNQPAMSEWRKAPVWVDGFEGRLQNSPWLSDSNGAAMTREGSTANQNSPFFRVYNTIQKHMVDDVFGKVELDYQIIDPLRIMLRSGMQKSQFFYEKRASWDNTSYRQGQFHRENTNSTRINTDLMLLYSQKVGDFDISATGGFNYEYSDSYMTRQEFNNLSRPEDFSLGAAAGGAGSISNKYEWGTGRTQSLFATASVGWKSMIYLEGSIRNDWYGLTALDKKSNLYPSVSGSWLISETFQLPDWFNLAKVRIGRAQVGYGIPSYINANQYDFNGNWAGASAGDWAGTSLGRVGGELIDPKLKPETNVTTEGGFDLVFLNNRVNFELTYFNKKHIDQIGDLPVVSSTGFSSMKANVGEVVSKGIEMSLNVTPVQNNDWTWNIGANFSSAKAKITKMNKDFDELWLDRNGQQTKLHIAVGEVMGSTWAQHNPYVIKSGRYAGKRLMNNTAGTIGYSETSDRFTCVGSFNPDFTMGFNTDLRYKRFHLNVVAALRVGGVYSSETHKRLRENGVTTDTFSGNNKWWVGGRVGYGGLPWQDPANMQTPQTQSLVSSSRRDFNDASYAVGVFVDPRSGYNQYDEELGDGTFVYNGQTRDIYVENGADPTLTYWLTPNTAMYSGMRYFLHDRTWDATNFKLREITLSYDVPASFTQKFSCQGASISFIAKNIFRWNKSGQFEDPESAFSGATGQMQGISRYLVPPIASYGFRLLLNF